MVTFRAPVFFIDFFLFWRCERHSCFLWSSSRPAKSPDAGNYSLTFGDTAPATRWRRPAAWSRAGEDGVAHLCRVKSGPRVPAPSGAWKSPAGSSRTAEPIRLLKPHLTRAGPGSRAAWDRPAPQMLRRDDERLFVHNS